MTSLLAEDALARAAEGSGWRQSALADFQAQGLPTRRNEAWKYTDIARTKATQFPLATPVEAVVADNGRMLLVNGFVTSTAAGPLTRLSKSEHLGKILRAADHPLVALNSALFTDGLLLQVPADTKLEQAVILDSRGQSGAEATQFHTRLLVIIEKGASATLVERHFGVGSYFANQTVEIVLGEGASLRHIKLQDDAPGALHLATIGVSLAAHARYESVVLQAGATLGRQEVHARLQGDYASLSLAGAVLAGQNQHLDITTTITHAALHTSSEQLFKTVLDGNGHGVFLGTVVVGKGAQKTDAHQLSRTLMLSDKAIMDCKPELEIYADDVKCSHGATIGDIDETALFYLRARGLDEATARHLLTEAFLVEAFDQIGDEALREEFIAIVAARLRQGKTVS